MTSKEKLIKVGKVFLWTGLPYAVLRVIEELAGLEGFSQYSPILNIFAYVAKIMVSE